MSTGKRLAKRSIIGTRVCALGTDGFYYAGVIQAVKSPHNHSAASPSFMRAPLGPPSDPALVSTSNSGNMYAVRFDVKRNAVGPGGVAIHPGVPQNREFRDVDLIGPGFRNILDCSLKRGQKIFVTHNGRECNACVLEHDIVRDEVTIKIGAIGHELPSELKKRLEEVRLLESRRSARLADQGSDTNFAQLADMAGDRRRPSHSIDVPFAFTQNGSRKRRPSYSQEEFMYAEDSGSMDDCNAALILLKLSASPHSPQQRQWKYGSSPGSSSASWSSGSSSPPLSDDNNNIILNNRNRTASLSTSDEGIVMDLMPKKIYKCTWKGCGTIFVTEPETVTHIRNVHLGPKKPQPENEAENDGSFSDSDDEEDFYYEEINEEPLPTSPPTLSHRDMARPPHEDPEYQMQIVMAHQNQYSNTIKPPLPIGSSSYSSSWPHKKHVRVSPRPSSSYSPYPQGMSHGLAQAQHNINTYLGTPSSGPSPNSPPGLQYLPSLPHHFNTTITPTISPASVSPSSSSTSSGSGSSIQLSPHIHHHSSTNKHGKYGTLHMSPKAMYSHSPKSSPGGSGGGGSGPNRSPLSPNRRTRGENKKCRKIYGMDQKASWCTQCKWKKACTRFSD